MNGRSSDFLLIWQHLPGTDASGKKTCRQVVGGTQQRDCPGVSPDSHLIRSTGSADETYSLTKIECLNEKNNSREKKRMFFLIESLAEGVAARSVEAGKRNELHRRHAVAYRIFAKTGGDTERGELGANSLARLLGGVVVFAEVAEEHIFEFRAVDFLFSSLFGGEIFYR